MADKIRQVAIGKIVVSISNPLNSTYSDLVTSPESSAAEELQKIAAPFQSSEGFQHHVCRRFHLTAN